MKSEWQKLWDKKRGEFQKERLDDEAKVLFGENMNKIPIFICTRCNYSTEKAVMMCPKCNHYSMELVDFRKKEIREEK